MYKVIFVETLKGKSLSRILQNLALSHIEISGDVMDLGSKSKSSSYYRFLKIKPDTKMIFSDLHAEVGGILKIDLEKTFPVDSDIQDFLLLNNVLEHLFDYEICISECFRILKKGGMLIGVVPFLHQIHPDPDDFFRYSHSALRRLFEESGFSDVRIKPLGFGPVTAGVSQYAMIIQPKLLRAFFNIIAIFFDKLLNKLFPKSMSVKSENFPLSYYFVCKK